MLAQHAQSPRFKPVDHEEKIKKTMDESQALSLMCVTGVALDPRAQPQATVLGGRALIKN